MFNAKVVQVLIASPSDVQPEREAIARVIHDWNALNGMAMNIVLLPVRWETHARPALGERPQGIINSQLVDDCDMAVGCFWTRVGSPTGVADSGTIEEIERIAARPAPVLLYFSNQPVVPSMIDTDQWNALLEFKGKIRERGLTAEYSDLDDLLQRLMSDLTREVRHSFVTEDVGDGTRNESPPERPSVAQTLNVYRRALSVMTAQARAQWNVLKDSFDQDDWRYMALSIRDQLVELQAQLSVYLENPKAALVSDLGLLASNAQAMVDQRYYMDGGRSLDTFQSMMQSLLDNLEHLTAEDWGDYVVSSLPVSGDGD